MSRMTYKTEIVDGRCYFNDGRKHVLVDTGYGRTVSIDGTIGDYKVSLCDKEDLQSFNPTIMNNGEKIGGILCPMNGYNAFITDKYVTIDNEYSEIPKCEWFIPFDNPFAPIVRCKVDGIDKALFFDSGMRLPALDDDNLIVGKNVLGKQLEWIGIMEGLFETPFYNATFTFPCGYTMNSKMEHDFLHKYVSRFRHFGVEGFLGLQFLEQFDVKILTVGKKAGIALVSK